MDFACYLVLIAVLILRPEDLIPALLGLRCYYITICCCILVTLPKMIDKITPRELTLRSPCVCVLLFFLSGIISIVTNPGRADLTEYLSDFGKVVIFFFLTISVLDSFARIRILAAWLIGCLFFMSFLAVGTYHGIYDLEVFKPVAQNEFNRETGEAYMLYRLIGSGVFSDPNDVCIAMVIGIMSSVFLALSSASIFTRFLWLFPPCWFVYTISLTHSRGGLLGMLAAVAAWLFLRFGQKRSLPLIALAIPVMLVIVGGRGANISGGGTAHERLMLWASGIGEMVNQPVRIPFGLGIGYYADEYGLVAHNTYVHTYVETGVLGGGALLMAMLMVVYPIFAMGNVESDDKELKVTREYIFALTCGLAIGMYSLSRQYVVPTYLVLGMGTAFLSIAVPDTPEKFRVSPSWLMKAALISMAGLIFLKVFTQSAGVMGV